MATPKEKAKELVRQFGLIPFDFDGRGTLWKPIANLCAIKCCDEVIEALRSIIGSEVHMYSSNELETITYWQTVRSEIEGL